MGGLLLDLYLNQKKIVMCPKFSIFKVLYYLIFENKLKSLYLWKFIQKIWCWVYMKKIFHWKNANISELILLWELVYWSRKKKWVAYLSQCSGSQVQVYYSWFLQKKFLCQLVIFLERILIVFKKWINCRKYVLLPVYQKNPFNFFFCFHSNRLWTPIVYLNQTGICEVLHCLLGPFSPQISPPWFSFY